MKHLLLSLLLIATGLPAIAADDSAASVFLVAREGMADPNFSDTVVLIAQFGPEGAMGVIVNRPTKVPLSEAFPDIKRLGESADRVHFGGPVSRTTITYLFRSSTAPKDGLEVMEGVYLSGNADLLRELLSRDKSAESVRVFAGYAGWAPGQLEGEISRGDWRYFKAEARSIFERKPESLWPELNRRSNATTASFHPGTTRIQEKLQ